MDRGRTAGRRARHAHAPVRAARRHSPTAFYERDWAAEEWSRGCYGAYLPPGAWTAFGRALRPPVGPLHWAGSEHAERWSGYMEGAVRSGEGAAATLLRSLTV